jgi:hypothetical protein
MIPPYQQRGQPVSPAAFNQLVDLAKSAQITGINGGTFQRSVGGTNINIFPQSALTAGGGAALPCPFQVTNASDTAGMKVEIQWGLIWQRLPTGMFPDNDPPLRMAISGTSYVYSKIEFNKDTLLPVGVSFSIETEIKNNTDTIQYNLIAVVTVTGEGDEEKISAIQNICQQPYPSPCSLAPSE